MCRTLLYTYHSQTIIKISLCRYVPPPVGTAAGAFSISCLPEVGGRVGKLLVVTMSMQLQGTPKQVVYMDYERFLNYSINEYQRFPFEARRVCRRGHCASSGNLHCSTGHQPRSQASLWTTISCCIIIKHMPVHNPPPPSPSYSIQMQHHMHQSACNSTIKQYS